MKGREPSAWVTQSAIVLLMLGLCSPGRAQTFEGRVIDERDERPVATALVRLVEAGGEPRAVAIADSSGFYRLLATEPGVYRLEAARLGFEDFQTPLLEARAADGVYPIDLLLRPAPVEIAGLRVEADRLPAEGADRQIRLMLGVSVASLRHRPMRFEEIQDHAAKGRGLEDAMRWSQTAGLIVSYTTDGPCFSLRARGCLPVYLNGLRLNRDFMGDVPLDMIHTIVVVSPTDGVLGHPGGALLLYTEAWLR